MMMMTVEQSVELVTDKETAVLIETYPSVALSTTHPTWLDPGFNPGLHGGMLATNFLSYDTANSAS
jgi:hypothetical protein